VSPTVAAFRTTTEKMITDDELYRLAIFLGAVSMILIVIYHFFEVNANKLVHEKPTGKGHATTSHPAAKNTGTGR
jgi:hypothetical protein